MYCTTITVSITLSLLVTFPAQIHSTENPVRALDDDQFGDMTKAQDWSLILFYRNWCIRSKRMLKEMEKAAEFMKTAPLFWAKVDCETDGAKTCEKFAINDFPVLFLLKRGNYFKELMSKPDYVGIVRFARTETGPGYTVLNGDEEEDMFFSGRDVKLVGTFKSEESALKKSFLRLVEEWKHVFDFGVNASRKVTDEDEGVVLFRPEHLHNKFEPSSVKYQGNNEAEDLEEWINTNKHGIVGHRHKYNHRDFKEPLIVVYYSLDYEKAPQVTHYWRNRVIKVAKNHPQMTFAVSAIKDFNKELGAFGYDFVNLPKPVACAYIDGKRYPMQGAFSAVTLEGFVEDLKAGKIEAHMRSEDVPSNNEGPVKVAVARNFDDLIRKSGKDSFVKFYAPWCSWCRKLTPVWEQLADAMKEENVDIIKFNGESNELPPEYKVEGYPTLYWVPKDNKKSPVIYQGGRSLQDFIKYVSKHATDELDGFGRDGEPKTTTTATTQEDKKDEL